MFVSEKHGFVFFHAQKTAGSFIERQLAAQLGEPEWKTEWGCEDWKTRRFGKYIKHVTPADFAAKCPDRFRDFVKFSTARNPYDYALSYFSMVTQWPKYARPDGHHCKTTGRIHPLNDFADLNDYLDLADRGFGSKEALRCLREELSNPITRFLTLGDITPTAPIGVDYVLRFENLQADIDELFPKLGIDPVDLGKRDSKIRKGDDEPRDCSSRHAAAAEVYNARARAVIQKRNQADLLRFGYNFPE